MRDNRVNPIQLRWCPIDGTVCGEDCEYCGKIDEGVNSKDGYSEKE